LRAPRVLVHGLVHGLVPGRDPPQHHALQDDLLLERGALGRLLVRGHLRSWLGRFLQRGRLPPEPLPLEGRLLLECERLLDRIRGPSWGGILLECDRVDLVPGGRFAGPAPLRGGLLRERERLLLRVVGYALD
jgi:hypothetical protein